MAAASNGTPAPKPVRCAIYTRKSTEEGLNQEFNSLDAQREAGEAYILSQKHDGWTLVPTNYSDGGYTGANIERPGVRQLLADIEAGKIDCVVVYKVDRLSRSLIDFARMMELFEKRGVCFVSVTQQFNTKASLGRLTLNILLSFAQFEREIISERTRDKQVAARKKGKWTGGHILLGYDLDSRAGKLAVNAEEAERIREMFRLYLEGTPVIEIVQRFDKLGWRNKQWTTQDGKLYGGSPLRRCHIYKLLGNVLYTGQVRVGDEIFPGEHEAIIDQPTFELAQVKLKDNTWKSGNPHRIKMDALSQQGAPLPLLRVLPVAAKDRRLLHVTVGVRTLGRGCGRREHTARGRPPRRARRDSGRGAPATRRDRHRPTRGTEHDKRSRQESEVSGRPAPKPGGAAIGRDPGTTRCRRSPRRGASQRDSTPGKAADR